MKLQEYNEWAEYHFENDPSHKLYDCDGSGEVECECCGQSTECEECDGSGQIFKRHVKKPTQVYTKEAYALECIRLLAKYSAWVNKSMPKVISNIIEIFIYSDITMCAAKNPSKPKITVDVDGHFIAKDYLTVVKGILWHEQK